MLGWPGVNVPAGFTEDGLPIGAQLLGPANSEPRLLALAAQLEAERALARAPSRPSDLGRIQAPRRGRFGRRAGGPTIFSGPSRSSRATYCRSRAPV